MADLIADVIAGAALLVAARPTIEAALKPARLSINVREFCYLYHYCGHPQLLVYIDIWNSGARSTTISSIVVTLARDDEDKSWKLSAQTYIVQDIAGRLSALLGERTEMLIGGVTLSPNEHWRELINAYNYPSRADEKTLSELVASMDEQVSEKRSTLGIEPSSKELVEVNESLTRQATEYFNGHFFLSAGNYKITIEVQFGEGKRLTRFYSFTLWDRQAKELHDAVTRYKYGITFAHSKRATFAIRLSPIGKL
jgi:hypothetical protein